MTEPCNSDSCKSYSVGNVGCNCLVLAGNQDEAYDSADGA